MYNFSATRELRKEEHPTLYRIIKVIAALLTLISGSLLADFYLPTVIESDTVLEVRSGSTKAGYNPYEQLIITSHSIIVVSNEYSRQIEAGDTIQRYRSTLFGITKGHLVNALYWLDPKNVFTANAFFLKIVLTSIFVWVFARPKYWMVAITAINIVTLLVISGLSAIWIAGLAFAIAFAVFFYSASKA